VTFWLMLAGFLGTTNAGRVALALGDSRAPRRTLATAVAAGAALVLALALVADPLLDALDISPESFRIGTGIVLVAAGAVSLVRPRPSGPPGAVLVTPELSCMAIAASADEGVGPALGAAAIALAVVAALALLPRVAPAGRAAPFLAALAVIVGVALVVAGVRDV
jgi:small neutral amino acid transporter SnatA (MarC family)